MCLKRKIIVDSQISTDICERLSSNQLVLMVRKCSNTNTCSFVYHRCQIHMIMIKSNGCG